MKGYSIERPARIALDLLGTGSNVDIKRHNLGSGNARSVTVVEAKDRTRLIFNLEQLTGYDTRVEGQQLVITLGGGQRTPAPTRQARRRWRRPAMNRRSATSISGAVATAKAAS
ncbi:hypothetical protein ASALC70_01695 [Alcanivorax sp. ALC70]|nr:hypothetical protein ASALC70_01695 [Alcanivorax sp. ALC70]